MKQHAGGVRPGHLGEHHRHPTEFTGGRADVGRQGVGGQHLLQPRPLDHNVDRLEKADLTDRRPNPEDRRSSIVELTPAGRTMLETARETFDDELDRLLRAPLSASALARFAGALDTVRRAATPPPVGLTE